MFGENVPPLNRAAPALSLCRTLVILASALELSFLRQLVAENIPFLVEPRQVLPRKRCRLFSRHCVIWHLSLLIKDSGFFLLTRALIQQRRIAVAVLVPIVAEKVPSLNEAAMGFCFAEHVGTLSSTLVPPSLKTGRRFCVVSSVLTQQRQTAIHLSVFSCR